MADRYLIIDDVTGRQKRGGAAGIIASEPVDQDFDIGAGGVTQVVLSSAITSLQKIDVFVNGMMEREGATYDWQKDVANTKITFNYTVPQNAWVRVRRYS